MGRKPTEAVPLVDSMTCNPSTSSARNEGKAPSHRPADDSARSGVVPTARPASST